MMFSDLTSLFLPRRPDSESDTGTSNTSGASESSGPAMALDNHARVENAVRECDEAEKARSFQIAFNQGNLAMMALLTDIGGYKPPASLTNTAGVTLEKWLGDQAKIADDQRLSQLTQIGSRVENPSMALSASTLAQISSVQLDASQWMRGLSLTSTPVLPPAPQRSLGHTMAA